MEKKRDGQNVKVVGLNSKMDYKTLETNIDDKVQDCFNRIEALKKQACSRTGRNFIIFGMEIDFLEGKIEGMNDIKLTMSYIEKNENV